MKIHFVDSCCNISRTYIDSFRMVNDIEYVELNEADIICYIGCAYTKERIDQSIEEIKNLTEQKRPNTKLAVFGCMTAYEDFYNYFKENKEIDYIGRGYGQKMQKELISYLESKMNNQELFYTDIGFNFQTPERINVVVQDGCSKRCAFCKSNYLNLKLKSTPLDKIIPDINYFSNELGVTEINISGLNPTDYGLDLYGQPKLTELIREISKIPTIESILLESLCIDRINNDLLNEILTNSKIKRVMIPVQSMDDRLLQLMGRKNTSQEAYNILKSISTQRPDIFIETIFLTCYPTEDNLCIDKNIKLLEDVRIHNPVLSVYKYGKNVKSLKSEQIVNMSEDEHYELLGYYYDYMIPLIEQQRKELLSKPVEGKLTYKDDNFDYYSTLYRFSTNEFSLKCPVDHSIDLGQKVLISSEFLPSKPNIVYETKNGDINGCVLRKIM